MPKIAFIIPFGSEKIYRDFDLATSLLQGTVNSLLNQSNSNFRVVIGCHEIPDIKLKENQQNFHFVPMSYDPLEEQYRTSPVRDMLMKIFTSLLTIKDENFDYCMLLDADDRIHQNLVEFVAVSPMTDVWVMDKGYRFDYPSRRVSRDDSLNNICGSTVLLSRQVAYVPQAYTVEEFTRCWWHKNTHKDIKSFSSNHNLQLNYVPFYAVQKTINTSMNLSDQLFHQKASMKAFKDVLRFRVFGRPMSQTELSDFGFLL